MQSWLNLKVLIALSNERQSSGQKLNAIAWFLIAQSNERQSSGQKLNAIAWFIYQTWKMTFVAAACWDSVVTFQRDFIAKWFSLPSSYCFAKFSVTCTLFVQCRAIENQNPYVFSRIIDRHNLLNRLENLALFIEIIVQ